MISSKRLQIFLNDNSALCDSEYFLKTHIYVEGYVKRVMLIGLRLNGVQYANSEKIVEGTYIPTANLIEKVLWLLDSSGHKQKKVADNLKKTHPDFFILKDLVVKFTAIYRNRLAHGTIDKLADQELVKFLCHTNRSFFQSFEALLEKEHGHSAFDKPRDWGAQIGIQESIENTLKRLNLGSLVKEPMQLKDVKSQLQSTAYANP